MGTHPIFESDFDCLTEDSMSGLISSTDSSLSSDDDDGIPAGKTFEQYAKMLMVDQGPDEAEIARILAETKMMNERLKRENEEREKKKRKRKLEINFSSSNSDSPGPSIVKVSRFQC